MFNKYEGDLKAVPISLEHAEKIQDFISNLIKPVENKLDITVLIRDDDGVVSFGNVCEMCMLESWMKAALLSNMKHDDNKEQVH